MQEELSNLTTNISKRATKGDFIDLKDVIM